MELYIDQEFYELIAESSKDEIASLLNSLLAEGCREALIVWDQPEYGLTIVDGHNRYQLCREHNIPFRIQQMEFASRYDVKIWMLNNQLARRNLTPYQKINMTMRMERIIAEQAKARQTATLKQNTVLANWPKRIDEEEPPKMREDYYEEDPNAPDWVDEEEPQVISAPINTREIMADMAGVSPRTYAKAKAIIQEAPPAIVEAVQAKDISIHRGYEITKQLRDVPEPERDARAEEIRRQMAESNREIDRRTRLSKEIISAMGAPISAHITEEAVDAYFELAPQIGETPVERCDMAITALQQLKALFSQRQSLRRV